MVMGARIVLIDRARRHRSSPSWSASRWACPPGYFGGKLDTVLSFLANLVLAFPVILLFYLLVTPEISGHGDPAMPWRAVLFLFPIIFLVVLF